MTIHLPRAAAIPPCSALPYPFFATWMTRAPKLRAISIEPPRLPLSEITISPFYARLLNADLRLSDTTGQCLCLIQTRHHDRYIVMVNYVGHAQVKEPADLRRPISTQAIRRPTGQLSNNQAIERQLQRFPSAT
jgi:hypothetical protein